jgi:hypothetical protein
MCGGPNMQALMSDVTPRKLSSTMEGEVLNSNSAMSVVGNETAARRGG